MQDSKECYISHSPFNLHKHHIFAGSRRKASEKHGCWVWLRSDWHNMSDYGIHFNKALDAQLKQECQMKFEETHSREDFIQIFGKSYFL